VTEKILELKDVLGLMAAGATPGIVEWNPKGVQRRGQGIVLADEGDEFNELRPVQVVGEFLPPLPGYGPRLDAAGPAKMRACVSASTLRRLAMRRCCCSSYAQPLDPRLRTMTAVASRLRRLRVCAWTRRSAPGPRSR